MATRHRKAEAKTNFALAQETLREEQDRLRTAEQTRANLLNVLGTDEQVAGTGAFGGPEGIENFTGRFRTDSAGLGDLVDAVGGLPDNTEPFTSLGVREKKDQNTLGRAATAIATFGASEATGTDPYGIRYDESRSMSGGNQYRGGLSPLEYLDKAKSDVNAILQQAEDAFRAGNPQLAEELRQHAFEVVGTFPSHIQALFNYMDDPESKAIALASNPMAQLVGGQIKEARGLMERGSAESNAFLESLRGPSIQAVRNGLEQTERQIAFDSRRTQTTLLRSLKGPGAGARNPVREAAILVQVQRQAAFDTAQARAAAASKEAELVGQANLFYEKFRVADAQDTVRLAMDFISDAPGLRDEFQQHMSNVAQARSALFQDAGAKAFEAFMKESETKALQRSANLEAGLKLATTIVGGVLLGPAGAAAGAAAGSAITA